MGVVETSRPSDVLAWFRASSASDRVEFLSELIACLLPLEIRIAGRLLEELGKWDGGITRSAERLANDPSLHGAALGDLSQAPQRAALLTALPLLAPANAAAAASLFHLLSAAQPDPDALPELLTATAIARHHAAFRVEQRLALSDLRIRLLGVADAEKNPGLPGKDVEVVEDNAVRIADAAEASGWNGKDESSTTTTTSLLSLATTSTSKHLPPSVYFVAIHASPHPSEKNIINIQTTWSSGERSLVQRTSDEIYEFHRRLLDLFPFAAGWGQTTPRTIPYFPHRKEGMLPLPLSQYLRELDESADMRIKSSSCACEFFGLTALRRRRPTSPLESTDEDARDNGGPHSLANGKTTVEVESSSAQSEQSEAGPSSHNSTPIPQEKYAHRIRQAKERDRRTYPPYYIAQPLYGLIRDLHPNLIKYKPVISQFTLNQLIEMTEVGLARAMPMLDRQEIAHMGEILYQLRGMNGFAHYKLAAESGDNLPSIRRNDVPPGMEALFVETGLEAETSKSCPPSAVRAPGRAPGRSPPPLSQTAEDVQSFFSRKEPRAHASVTIPSVKAASGSHRWVPGPPMGFVHSASPPPGPLFALPPQLSCANCGQLGHSFPACAQPSIAQITAPGMYRLNVRDEWPPQ